MQWHGRLGLPPASNQAFGEYLERELQVTPDAAPFSGESHWWTPEILSPVLGGSAATAAARPQDAPRATLGTPAWAFNPHPRCADSCCPVQCPPARISTASTWQRGPYDGPPSAYPGLASQALPYAAVAAWPVVFQACFRVRFRGRGHARGRGRGGLMCRRAWGLLMCLRRPRPGRTRGLLMCRCSRGSGCGARARQNLNWRGRGRGADNWRVRGPLEVISAGKRVIIPSAGVALL